MLEQVMTSTMTFVLNSIYEWDYYMLCRSASFISYPFI
jgi:hypothetical protein